MYTKFTLIQHVTKARYENNIYDLLVLYQNRPSSWPKVVRVG